MVTGLSLLNEIEDRLGWEQTASLESSEETKETRKLLRALNRVLQTFQGLDDWPLLREFGQITTVASTEDDYQLILTNGSVTVTAYSGTPFTQVMTNMAITIGTEKTVYRIKKWISETEIELNKVWVGDDYESADYVADSTLELACVIAQDQYVLPSDFDRPSDENWGNFFSPYGILATNPTKFNDTRRARGFEILTEDPRIFTAYGADPADNYRLIHLDPFPDSQRILEFAYQKDHPRIADDNDKILYPTRYHGLLIDAVLDIANRDYEDDQKMQVVHDQLIQAYNRMKANPEITEKLASLRPDASHRINGQQRWGRNPTNVDYGEHFDIAGNTGLR